jgi:hypothetical protein
MSSYNPYSKDCRIVRANNKNDVPTGHHFAILVYTTSSTYVPGDERSRTNPGHGYPGGYETHNSFEHYVTHDKPQWESLIKELHLEKKNFVFFEVEKLGQIEVQVKLI